MFNFGSSNKVMLIGTVGRDPESKELNGGNLVCNFSIATTEKVKAKGGSWEDRTEWHNITCWGKTAELAQRFIFKGAKVHIDGKIQTDSWTDNQGNKKSQVKIIANDITMLSQKREDPSQSKNSSRGDKRYQQDNKNDYLPF